MGSGEPNSGPYTSAVSALSTERPFQPHTFLFLNEVTETHDKALRYRVRGPRYSAMFLLFRNKSKSFHLTKHKAPILNDSSFKPALGVNSLITDNRPSLQSHITQSEITSCQGQFLHMCVCSKYACSHMRTHVYKYISQKCISTVYVGKNLNFYTKM